MSNFRRQIWFSGHVQGVGFRYKTVQVASGYDVAGFVKNLDDGRVYLCAVGDEREVKEFTEQLQSVMRDFIRQSDVRDDVCDFKYKGFKIEL